MPQLARYWIVTGLLRVPRYGLRVLNRMVSFFITRNTQLVTRNIIFQRKNNILSEIDNKLSIWRR
jgi:hypothetical protein